MEKEINLNKIVSIITDGARNMTGNENASINFHTKQTGHSVLDFHCIIHWHAMTSFMSLDTL